MMFCGVLIVLVSNGLRLTFGLFQLPMSVDLGFGRQVFGLVIALQVLLFGLVQPIAGMFADRFGAVKVIVGGAILYAAGLWLASFAASAFDLYISLGMLVGIGLSGTTQVVVLGAIGRVVPNERRGIVFGTVVSAGSLGMFVLVPGVQAALDLLEWRQTLVLMAFLIIIISFVAMGLRLPTWNASGGPDQSLREAVGEARGHTGYVLLTLGFFVCGFHVTFIATHFPAYLADNVVSSTAAAYALGTIGLANIVGAYLFGAAGDRFRKKDVLTLIYFSRAIVMTAMLVTPINDVTAVLFGAALGILWIATVPLTSGIVAQVFGPRHFSMLFGVVFMSHQIGGFTGAWLGGYIYDIWGSYDVMWGVSVVLGLLAAALHWPISDYPLKRLSERTTVEFHRS